MGSVRTRLMSCKITDYTNYRLMQGSCCLIYTKERSVFSAPILTHATFPAAVSRYTNQKSKRGRSHVVQIPNWIWSAWFTGKLHIRFPCFSCFFCQEVSKARVKRLSACVLDSHTRLRGAVWCAFWSLLFSSGR